MSGAKSIQRLLNLLTVVLLVVIIGKQFFALPILDVIGTFPAVIALGLIYFMKNFVETHYNITDPILGNRITKMFYYIGMGCIVLAVLFKIMHWPFQTIIMILGVVLMILSFALSLVLEKSEVEKNEDILDDMDE